VTVSAPRQGIALPVVQVGRFQLEGPGHCASEKAREAVERFPHYLLSGMFRQVLCPGSAHPCSQQWRAQRQRRPERREGGGRRVEERGIPVPTVIQLLPKGLAEAQAELQYRAGCQSRERFALGLQRRDELHFVRLEYAQWQRHDGASI